MKNSAFLLLILTFQSCQYFEKNVPKKEVLLQEELQKINWEEVDEFPSTLQCDSINDKIARKQCLFEYITNTIQEKFSQDSIKIHFPKLDTIPVKVTIFPNSKITFKSNLKKYSRDYDIVTVDSVLQSKLRDFPAVEPAIKRGIKVKTQFVLPIILKSE